MKYLHTMIRVSDPAASIGFFELLGLNELSRFDSELGRFTLIFLAASGDEEAQVELTHNWDEVGYGEGRNFGHLAYRVDNIYETCQRLMDAVEGIAGTMARCGAGLCATPALQREIEARGRRARVTLNGVSDEMVRLSEQAVAERPVADGAIRVGFPGGHPGHTFNLPVAEEALAALLRRHANVRVVLIGYVPAPPRLHAWASRVDHVPYVDWRRLPFELARLDVCIAPLADNPFNRCKSDIKFLEAALARVPVVASPVGQLGETIREGVTGLLADDTPAWTEALSSLVEQPALRARLAKAAAEEVLRYRTSAALGPALVEALGSAGA